MTEKLSAYNDFLLSKVCIAPETGLIIEIKENQFLDKTVLKPHQKDAIEWAIRGGRRALFESFGLGKTIQQLIICKTILETEGGKALIVCPLGVRGEFFKDAKRKLGIDLQYVKTQAECENAPDGSILITNYERVRDGNINPQYFTVTSLDEASVLRSYGSKTYQTFLDKFKGVKYKFVCTATPSPNKYKELIHYAGYLEIMDTGQALTRFFKRDSTQANNLTIYPHKEKEFWLWMSTWALFITKPSDLGYTNEGYDLPEMKVIYHKVKVDHKTAGTNQDGQVKMFREAALGLKDAAKEKRNSLELRACKMLEIITNFSDESKQLTNENTEREKQRLLRNEQGKGETEIFGILPSEQRENRQTEEKGIHGGVSKNLQAQSKNTGGKRAKEVTETGALSERQGISRQSEFASEGNQKEKSEYKNKLETKVNIRNNSGKLQSNICESERKMCNLSNSSPTERDKESVCRPLPFRWECERSALLELQFWFGTLQRRYKHINESDRIPEQIIIWCNLNREQELIEKLLKNAGISVSSIYGSLSDEEKERRLNAWKNKETTVFLSKPEMYGSGVNLQQASKMIFTGIDYEFNSFIQAIHRIYRFLQLFLVEIHIIYAESEGEILKALEKKWKQHNYLVDEMTKIIKENGLSNIHTMEKLKRSIISDSFKETGKLFNVINGDAVPETMAMEENSKDLIVTSIPFSNHYEYTPTYNDFGHTSDNEHFFEQMDYLTPELFRILKPGRVAAIHVKDRILFGNATGDGMPTLDPFSDFTVMHFLKHGFRYFGRITIETDVVRENNQTYRLGWTEQCKDGSKMGVGCPEYILLFRKLPSDTSKAYADFTVTKTKEQYTRGQWQIDARAKWNSSGERFLTPDEIKQLPIDKVNKYYNDFMKTRIYDYENHVNTAKELDKIGKLPATFQTLNIPARTFFVWDDVNRMLTLNGSQSNKKLQMHICPLQFDIVDRLINRFSNAGDLVFDPFGGLMTVPYRAIKLGRKGEATELNPESYRDGLQYLRAAEINALSPSLFTVFENDLTQLKD